MQSSMSNLVRAASAVMVCALLHFAASSLEAVEKPSAEAAKFFETRVRPLLAAHCFECHGAKKQEAGLRLDVKTSLLKGIESGPVVISGQPDKSRLIEVIEYGDPDAQMPPDAKLKPAEIAILKRWVQIGLPWPGSKPITNENETSKAVKSHWAFQPILLPTIPEVAHPQQPNSAIDRFVLARLESKQLGLSRAADRHTLIRRVTYGLTGLPPSPEEVAAFERDESPDAYERLIDRLLASPHYGERWGRHWLDVARYADNKGYVFFEEKKFPWAYTYRDYVIRAFNSDLPYDQFVLEQLAADRLVQKGEDNRSLAAMGYLTLGARFMNNTHDVIDDRIDVVTRGLMGLTVTCSRCHDHKFDPVSQRDYYALYGVFRSSPEPTLQPQFTPPPQTEEYRKFEKGLQDRMAKLNEFIDRKHAALVTDGRKRAAEYLMRTYERRKHPSTENFMLLVPAGDLNPTMTLRWETYLEKADKSADPVWTAWHAFAEIDEEQFAKQSPEVTANIKAAATDSMPINRLVRTAFSGVAPKSMKDVAERYGKLLAAVENPNDSAASPAGAPDPAERQLQEVMYGAGSPPNVPRILGWGFLSLLPDRPAQGEFKKLIKEVETWSMTGKGAPPRAMTLVDAEQPFESRVFLRGNPNRLGESVPRRFISLLNPNNQPFAEGSGRLELGRAIVNPANPLTARVIVNRIWRTHFGAGLVATPSDFGLRSDPPTHPQLLDYLAADFMQNGWSIKRLHRQIMTSHVYRQQSGDRPECRRVDPENRLLWRMNRHRLDFEAMRDAMLSVAGTHDETLYGPPRDILTGYVPRRTVYGFVDRMDLPELLRSFDFPSPVTTSPQRTSTTVPPQALYLMNSNFARETARQILRRPDIATVTDMENRVDRLHQLLFARSPDANGRKLSRQFLGEEPSAATWEQYVQGLLMVNEFVFVD